MTDSSREEPAAAESVDLTELRRLAFGRPDPSDPDRHLRAQRRLAELNAERDAADAELRRVLDVAASPPAEDPHSEPPRLRSHALVVLSVALAILLGVSVVALSAPVPSLEVFDRAQTAEEAELALDLRPLLGDQEPEFESLRLLGELDGVIFVAMRVEAFLFYDGVAPGICLYSVGHGGAGAACGPLEQVRVEGISGSSGPYSFSWGPTGPIELTGGQSD